MFMANADVDVNLLLELQRLGFAVECKEQQSEVWVTGCGVSLQNDRLLRAIEIISHLAPNECDIVDGALRLWWD